VADDLVIVDIDDVITQSIKPTAGWIGMTAP